MNAIAGYHLIKPEDLTWRPSNLMRNPNADFSSEPAADIGRKAVEAAAKSANAAPARSCRGIYFVVAGTGRIRVGEETLTVPCHGGSWSDRARCARSSNDTDSDVLWLIVGAPEAELEPHERGDLSLVLPGRSQAAPAELTGIECPQNH